MQFFKTLPLLAISAVFLAGCMNYQYSTVSSNLKAGDDQEFFLENDTLMISYSFYGYGGPVRITIQNKLDVPLYVDWKQSALVMNDHSNTYWQNTSRLEATAEGYQVQWTPRVSSTSATITGEITGDEAIDFIAPDSYKESNMVMIGPDFVTLSETEKQYQVMDSPEEGPADATCYRYGDDNSPLKFRSYLTISTDPSFVKPLIFESSFWIAEIVQTKTRPDYYLDERRDQNKFYTSSASGAGAVLGIGVLFLLLGITSVH
ncbi:hypothetical protein [Cesiribacter sp. SM1]|uniref:hypothetical protein n=1 Tax=Cesiribacter sp. SM1 TaxID=2861196 RepID=UPI001CD6FAC5|nr:hypothetical protein [Cesiribacter sp. SM1]